MQRTLSAALAVAALVLATGCGGDGDDVTTTPAEEPTATADPAESAAPAEPAPLPTCASVWPKGTALPDDYTGCRENGERVVRSVRCESGQQLFTYAGRYFAVPGGPIFSADGALADDPQFQKMERVCTA